MNIDYKSIINLSNLLTIIRLLLVIPLYVLFQSWGQSFVKESILILLIIAAITDILDGYLARKFGHITEFGKILDPISDKILIAFLLFEVIRLNLLPYNYLIIVILRDILILLGGIYCSKKTGIILQSNFLGKITALAIGIVIFLRIFGFSFGFVAFDLIFYLSIFLIIVSFIVYLYRLLKVLSGKI